MKRFELQLFITEILANKRDISPNNFASTTSLPKVNSV